MAGRSLEHSPTDEEVAAAETLLDQAWPLFNRSDASVALKVVEMISDQLLRRVVPQHRAAVMELHFANIRQRVRGDA